MSGHRKAPVNSGRRWKVRIITFAVGVAIGLGIWAATGGGRSHHAAPATAACRAQVDGVYKSLLAAKTPTDVYLIAGTHTGSDIRSQFHQCSTLSAKAASNVLKSAEASDLYRRASAHVTAVLGN